MRPLSPSEQEVMDCVARGLPNKAIAIELGMDDIAVKVRCRKIFMKLGVRNRTEAAVAWLRAEAGELAELRRQNAELRAELQRLSVVAPGHEASP